MRAETLARTASTRSARVLGDPRTAGRCMITMVLVAIYLVCATAGWSAITKVDVANKPDRAVVTVCGDSPLRMTPMSPARGNYLAFQFPCRLAAKGRLVGIREGGIYNVRYSNFRPNPPVTRIVVNTDVRHYYATDWSDDRRRVEISIMKTGCQPAKPEVQVKGEVQEISAPEPVADAAVSAPSDPLPLPDMMPRAEPVEFGPKLDQAAMMVAMAAEAEPVPEIQDRPIVVAKAESKPEPKPIAIAKAEPKPEPKPEPVRMALAPKTDRRLPVRVASANPDVMASLPTVSAEPKRWSPERTISLNFLGADINEVLKALAIQSGHNIVASKDVKGNVTVSLNKVSLDEALSYVAKLSNYNYTNDNGTYLVAPKEALSSLSDTGGSKQGVQVASVAYANADEMMQLVKAQFPTLQVAKISKAAAESDSGKSSDKQKLASSLDSKLVFTGDAAAITAATAVVAQIDEAMKGQMVGQKSEVYRVKYVKPQDLAKTLSALVPGVSVYGAPQEGFDLPAPAAVTLSDTGATVRTASNNLANGNDGGSTASKNDDSTDSFDAKSKSRAVIIVGKPDDVAKALELASAIDIKSPQIKIDAKITSITESGEKKLGVTWSWGDYAVLEGPASSGESTGGILTADNTYHRQPWSFGATLDALVTSGDGKVLASPSLVCLEGKPGVFFVGEEVTYIQRIEQTATGQNITTDTKQVGVQLRVNGTANQDGFITLNLHPEVSVLKLNTEQGVTLPVVTRRFTDHVVRVKTGQTIVIGGLIRNDDIEEMYKVPLLGDIPLLGQLFRHRYSTKDHTEVVMFITASVLAD
jgi:type II secretory pathway component GspD/PulD (secretin)